MLWCNICGHENIITELAQRHSSMLCVPKPPSLRAKFHLAQFMESRPALVGTPNGVQMRTLCTERNTHWNAIGLCFFVSSHDELPQLAH